MTPKLLFSDRVAKAATLLSVSNEALSKGLSDAGLSNDSSGLALLDAETTTPEDLVEILQGCVPTAKKLQLKACAGILKGYDPLSKNDRIQYTSDSKSQSRDETVIEAVKALRPIQQWNDKELLEDFALNRSMESIEELDHRAKHQRFVILKDPILKNIKKYEPGKEEIDVEMTLKLLRDTRKRTIPGVIPRLGGVAIVYRITDLNLEDRIIEICPICGEALYMGLCESCQVNITGVGDDERAFMKLAVDYARSHSDSFGFSDRKALVASAMKGIDDLKITWPSIIEEFDRLKATGNLSKLKIIGNRPSTADPFFVDGARAFGNKSF